MSTSRLFTTAVVVASLLVTAATPANAILIAFFSLDRTTFAINDAPETKQRVENALRLKDCKFAGGVWLNGNWTLNFRGQTSSFNEMVRQLADCPDLSLEVSFSKLDKDCDWQVRRHHQDKLLLIIVNLNSQNIAMEEVTLPSNVLKNVAPYSK